MKHMVSRTHTLGFALAAVLVLAAPSMALASDGQPCSGHDWPCAADVKALCPDASSRGEVRRCLHEHADQVSPACAEKMEARRQRHATVLSAGPSHVAALCPDARGGIRHCLHEHRGELSDTCSQTLDWLHPPCSERSERCNTLQPRPVDRVANHRISARFTMEPIAQTLDVRTVSLEREQRFFAFVEAHQERAVRMGGDHAGRRRGAAGVLQGLPRPGSVPGGFHAGHLVLPHPRQRSAQSSALAGAARPLAHRLGRRRDTRSGARRQSGSGLQRRLAGALDRLAHGQREVFVLVYLEGFTLEQTAAQLGKALGTVKTHLHRALRTRRVELADLRHPARHSTGGTP